MPIRPPQHRPFGAPTPTETRRIFDRARGSAHRRGYDRTWQRLRKAILAAEPLCRFCTAAGLAVPAEEVDHIEPIAERPDLRLDPTNLRGLCSTCHGRRTADYLRGLRY